MLPDGWPLGANRVDISPISLGMDAIDAIIGKTDDAVARWAAS